MYTAKVRFFKQITTTQRSLSYLLPLFCIPQRYDFSSKSQRALGAFRFLSGCFVYRKGTIFQANHNSRCSPPYSRWVVLYTAKVRFFKQITTQNDRHGRTSPLFCIPQRYDFSSKSQPISLLSLRRIRCFVYRKGTIFQANHNNCR